MDIRFKFVPSYNSSEYSKLNKCIFFMHIPKSGGTTIDHIFAKLAGITGNFKYETINTSTIHFNDCWVFRFYPNRSFRYPFA